MERLIGNVALWHIKWPRCASDINPILHHSFMQAAYLGCLSILVINLGNSVKLGGVHFCCSIKESSGVVQAAGRQHHTRCNRGRSLGYHLLKIIIFCHARLKFRLERSLALSFLLSPFILTLLGLARLNSLINNAIKLLLPVCFPFCGPITLSGARRLLNLLLL